MEALAFFTFLFGAIAANNAAVLEQHYRYHTHSAPYAQPAAVAPRWDAPSAVYLPVEPAPARWTSTPAPQCGSPCSSEFIGQWQNFMEPMVSRSGGRVPGFGPGQRD